ncbi:glycoside hydrolase family 43 protein [Paenibacillus anseongense]|uniref:glycoside hydrolase family 43 protein n=1 Tax=Paenibacillus anseongense TaxID=2682845 RepID=UPI002DBC5689|nr:glycoside hydrolase family 43 protein [Paenibacillus anseongense]MEC0268999.1 glycoside hydrolase family 43 protein [Paenibacillus anseongense]
MPVITNPIVPGFYADPEARTYEGKHWIYATRSFTAYTDQMNLDAFSSTDLIHWSKHEAILEMSDFPWVWRAVWAPTIIENKGKYYLVFASNDIQSNDETGGLEIAISDNPAGPFRGYLGKPLIDRFIHSAQPIDAHLFKDDDGTIYLYYGGWGHCNVAKMNEDMTGFVPFENGDTFLSVTPEGYVEGPCMIKNGDLYYFMWSMGSWVNGTYRVAYGISDSPLGPFENKGTILQKQEPIAEGPGHHGYLYLPETDMWIIVYHRRLIGDTDPGSRVLCIDRLHFEDGAIMPVTMTDNWQTSDETRRNGR